MRDLHEAATQLASELIALNTVNPPGAERAAIELLREALAEAGLEVELLALDDERPNLVARVRGESPGPTLGYLGHVDTVLAEPGEWSRDPWGGEVVDGQLWGRGALDMKGQVAAEVAAVLALVRDGWRPGRGELLVMCVADEEAGGELGARFLTERHPDRVRCDYVINEGGGAPFELDGRRLYSVCCAEKGVFRFTLTTRGTAGHGSIPQIADNALPKLAPLLERLGSGQPAWDVTEVPRLLLERFGAGDDPQAALAELHERAPAIAALVEPMLGVTVAPTRVFASEKVNVIPSRASVQVDCRVPPGLGEEEARARVEELIGHDGYELAFDETVEGNASAPDSPLMGAIEEWLGDVDPDAGTAPFLLPGFTDSRWFRAAFPDCAAYGFFPNRHMPMVQSAPLIHSADERIDVRDLAYAADFYAWLPRRLLG